VRLVDQEWVREQTANGARLALVGPERADRDERVQALEADLAAAQLEVQQLRRALAESDPAGRAPGSAA
jgi:hypothetical protein